MNKTYVLELHSSPLDELSPEISCPLWHPLAMSPRSAYASGYDIVSCISVYGIVASCVLHNVLPSWTNKSTNYK